jgi:hypothetical protein
MKQIFSNWIVMDTTEVYCGAFSLKCPDENNSIYLFIHYFIQPVYLQYLGSSRETVNFEVGKKA